MPKRTKSRKIQLSGMQLTLTLVGLPTFFFYFLVKTVAESVTNHTH